MGVVRKRIAGSAGLIGMCGLCLAATGCAVSPSPSSADYDRLWQASLGEVAARGFVVTRSDREEGLIVAERAPAAGEAVELRLQVHPTAVGYGVKAVIRSVPTTPEGEVRPPASGISGTFGRPGRDTLADRTRPNRCYEEEAELLDAIRRRAEAVYEYDQP
jgi:hypothetical protein